MQKTTLEESRLERIEDRTIESNNEQSGDFVVPEMADRNPKDVLIERPLSGSEAHPVNGNYAPEDDDEDEVEDDLILGDEDEIEGDEEEFEVELEEDMDEEDLGDDDDLVLDTEDDIEEEDL